MKGPLVLTGLILVVGAVWGVKEHQSLSKIRERHRLVVQEAEALGISTDPSLVTSIKHTRRQREDSVRKAKEFAEVLVAFAKEMKAMENSGKPGDESMQRRIMDMVDGMLSLNSDELKILIAELRGRTDLDDEMRKGMIGFSIMMLSQEHPEKALEIFTESSDLLDDNPMRKHVLASALTQWAKEQPLAAVEWMKRNADKHPELVNDEAKRAVVAGAAAKDFGLAFQLAAELKLPADDDSLLPMLSGTADTPERQRELLAMIRKQSAGMGDKKQAADLLHAGIACVFSQVSQSGYDKTMQWLQATDLSDSETAGLASNLNYRHTKEDTGKWLDWMAAGSDSSAMRNATRDLVREWTTNDYRSAGEWLAGAPASPTKEAAVMSYSETVAPYDPEVAAQWAETLTGSRKEETLKRIQSVLQAKDKAAAADFARRHGLPQE